MYKNLFRSALVGFPHLQILSRNSNNLFSIRLLSTHKNKSKRTNNMEPRYDLNRKWVLMQKSAPNKKNSFKLVSYNILAQDLLLEHMYLYVEIQQKCLIWRRRMQNIQRELTKLDPDIVCLQEMQYDHLPKLVHHISELNGKRLEYVYKKKTGSRTDGCAIIYDACKFQLLEHRGLEMFTENVPLLNRENVALLAKFRLKQPERLTENMDKEIVVATTHLLYNPKREDVRCAQVQKLMRELLNFARDANDGMITPVVLTGDFNSTINSEPIALLTDKKADDTTSFNFEALDPGECYASTFQGKWITVDYILRSACVQSKHQLQVQGVYSLPTVESCTRSGPIPNHYLGSDHYALGAVFALA
ncbi:protein angel [Scaptodrosophila lebanonensis]|uniref:Protein angel n=1 Tax=Drosophila lebanonensis TaxID=7225 RepID=A0A6J2T650_DROLE|nr:protein angel [Scaptodrosophila lebanonensis]